MRKPIFKTVLAAAEEAAAGSQIKQLLNNKSNLLKKE